MKKAFLVAAAAVAVTITGWAQQQPQQQQPAGQAAAAGAQASGSPVAKQPQPKSQAEVQALQGLFQAPDADTRVKAADEFVVKFPDSEFKGFALMMAAEMSRQKNEHDKAIIYAERALEADPQNYMAMLIMSNELALITREHDLDREEKLKRSEKYANAALEALKTAPRPRPDITDEQWTAAKKEQFEPEALLALGLAQLARKNCDAALDYMGKAVANTNPDPAKQLRLADANARCGKIDEAIVGFDKVLARADIPADFKAFAEKEKQRAMQRKGGAAPSAAAPAAQGKPATPATPASPAPAPAPPKP